MSVLAIVLIVLGALVALLFITGMVVSARRRAAAEAELRKRIAEANEALAQAHAQDRGWDRPVMEAAARAAFEALFPGEPIRELHLVQVVDRPGTDEDEAVVRVLTSDHEHEIRLGRRDGAWVAHGQ